ncbi:hypothetical protein PNEG_02886 [Pneumocystis murina B123]|uniref:Trafficking protein particle complex subunit n=1 Tax=Pneumocystis murina (strain B123) TaxID=1069680 RepID=M7NJB7_PNEMU|nr:hypothetical protein PNEG_02886 [Pneumocystis murina B123]EMR08708.1 hypothetical protein PNEG_02886 [Pneumocystis murina B123]
MTIYKLLIFNRSCKCIYHKTWNNNHTDNTENTEISLLGTRKDTLSEEDDAKLIFGVLYSLQKISKKLAGPDESFISYKTSEYKLHYYETASNIRFILLTDPNCSNLLHVLQQIYISLYVEYVVKNPLGNMECPKDDVNVELFELTLDQFIRSLSEFQESK